MNERAPRVDLRFDLDWDTIHRWAVGVTCVLTLLLSVVGGLFLEFGERLFADADVDFHPRFLGTHVTLWHYLAFMLVCYSANGISYLFETAQSRARVPLIVGSLCVLAVGFMSLMCLAIVMRPMWHVSPSSEGHFFAAFVRSSSLRG